MSSAPIPWKHVRHILVLFAPLWAGAALLFGLAGATFAVVKTDLWSARQPLVLRDEATNSADRLGRFASQTELKAAQETLLEMAQNPEVVAAALREIGSPDGGLDPHWPHASLIDEVASQKVNITAPKGSEFGSSEVVYLQVKQDSPQRAAAFCRAMFQNLSAYLRNVRRARADSIIRELEQARDLARTSLDEASDRMQKIEVRFGSDLGELRSLSDAIAGDGTNRRELEITARERQQAELELRKSESLHRLLRRGMEDPQHLLISGHELLSSQPSLERLKDGLIDAQLQTSRLSGIYTPDHPKLRAAIAHEAEIRQRIRQETAAVVRAMQPSLELQRSRVAELESKIAGLQERLALLAEARTRYAEVDAEVRNRTERLAEAETALSEALASRSAALASDQLVELGPPQVSDGPVGAPGSLLTLASTFAGLIFGLGVVFLIAPGPSEPRYGRRWTDFLGGRRASDRVPGKPVAAPPQPAPRGPWRRRREDLDAPAAEPRDPQQAAERSELPLDFDRAADTPPIEAVDEAADVAAEDENDEHSEPVTGRALRQSSEPTNARNLPEESPASEQPDVAAETAPDRDSQLNSEDEPLLDDDDPSLDDDDALFDSDEIWRQTLELTSERSEPADR